MRKRYFSICGFTSKRNEGNISDDLFCAKCMLRANFRIVKDLWMYLIKLSSLKILIIPKFFAFFCLKSYEY
jgi:hypothetical protein